MAGELITADYQVEWRGVVLGSASVWGTSRIEGLWDLPAQRGTNAALPGYHGSAPGPKTSGERYITWSFKRKGVPPRGFAAAVDELRRITAPQERPQEEDLVLSLDGQSWLVRVRVLRRNVPVDRHYAIGYTEGSVQWEATDPRIYSPVERVAAIGLASGSPSGLDFGSGGLDFGGGGLDFGGPPTGGLVVVRNSGHVPTWPVLEVIGPCTGPVITYGGRTLRFRPDFVVAAGQTVVLDTRPTWHTVEISRVSVRQRLLVAQWTPLLPGVDTQISFTAASYDASSLLRVKWRDAWH